MNKIIQILFSCLLILKVGTTSLQGNSHKLTHQRILKKRKTRRIFKQKKLCKKKINGRKLFGVGRYRLHGKNKRHRKNLAKQRSHRHQSQKRTVPLRRQKREEYFSPDLISINYAELKVRRMIARSDLPKKNQINAFNKIMKTLDLYEKNGHVSIPNMEKVVSNEINLKP